MLMREVIVVVDYEYNYTDVVSTGITGQGTRSTHAQLTKERGNSYFIVNYSMLYLLIQILFLLELWTSY